MLNLGRKVGENIVINDDIVITVVDILDDKVRIGITAPDGVPIFRRELLTELIERFGGDMQKVMEEAVAERERRKRKNQQRNRERDG